MSKLLDCKVLGVEISIEQMDNGENRFWLMKDGAGYILTEMSKDSCGWQNSHYHEGVMETYVVQRGWIASAEFVPEKDAMKMTVHRAGAVFTTHPGHHHNIYMSAEAVIHTVKHGDLSVQQKTGKDWFESKVLDALTKHLSEDEIFRLAGQVNVPAWAEPF